MWAIFKQRERILVVSTIRWPWRNFKAINVLFYNYNSKKYQEPRENQGAIVNIPSGLEIFAVKILKIRKIL